MNTAYWTVAAPLALFYLYAGTLKSLRTRDQLRPMMSWVDRVPLPALRALGTAEILGATGLVLPPLALAAAIALVLLQAGAITVHLTGGDRRIALNAGLAVGAAAAGWLATGL